MYTRPFNVPKNYNGVRFNGSREDIPVKEHRPSYDNGIKTSHSPLFKQENTDTPPDITEDSPFPSDTNEEGETLTEFSLENGEECVNCEPQVDAPSQKHFNLPIRELLNGINTEDALLIFLILLIAAEKDKDNNSMLTMLSLLLLKR